MHTEVHFDENSDLTRKKTIGDHNISAKLLKELQRHGVAKLTEVLNRIYLTGKWPSEEVQRPPGDHRSFIAHRKSHYQNL